MGEAARRGASSAGHLPHARPALFPQLRPDLVRLDAAGGRADQDPLLGALAGTRARAGAALQLQGLFQGLQLPARLAHAPYQKMFCVVIQYPLVLSNTHTHIRTEQAHKDPFSPALILIW